VGQVDKPAAQTKRQVLNLFVCDLLSREGQSSRNMQAEKIEDCDAWLASLSRKNHALGGCMLSASLHMRIIEEVKIAPTVRALLCVSVEGCALL
jgi:hypothetical protein